MKAFLAAVLGAAALAVPQAAAAPPNDGLVITGNRTAYVDHYFPMGVQFYGVTVETRGRFGGFYAQQLTSSYGGAPVRSGGTVAIRGLSPNPDVMAPMQFGSGGHSMDPGLVRIYLLADGPTTVRIDTNSGPGYGTLKPTKPAHAKAQVGNLRRVDTVWLGTLPVNVGKQSAALVAVQARGELARAADVVLCVRDREQVCKDEDPVPSLGEEAGTSSVASLDQESRWYVGKDPVRLAARHAVASATVKHERDLPYIRMAAFTLTLAP